MHLTWNYMMADYEPEYVETPSPIASNMVEGTAVYNNNGEKIGRIINFMVNKQTGQVEYAIMSFGGFLGLDHDHCPIPWKKMNYVIAHHGFVVNISAEKLAKAPKHHGDNTPIYDPAYCIMVNGYYGLGL